MPAIWTETAIINNLLRDNTFWSGSTITYGFPTVAPPFADATQIAGFSAFSAAQKAAAIIAINLWDDLISPSLVQTASNSQITFQNDFVANNAANAANGTLFYAYTYFPGEPAFGAGSLWVNNAYSTGTNDLVTPKIGQWGFMTYLHELGHAFGLDHPGNYNGGSPTYAANAAYTHDSIEYSVMSYFTADNTGADWIASDGKQYYCQTLMIDDVAAIQAHYGADLTTRTGNTTYGFHSTLSAVSGGIYDFTQYAHPIQTIWDGGGIDTLDLSGFSTNSRIDLHAGTSTDCDAMTNNIWIAYNCTIENATGGTGNDSITGNDVNNILIGGAGNDVLTGGAGNDAFIFNVADVTAGQSDVITDFTHDALGAGDTVRLVGVGSATLTLAMSGANAVVGYGNGSITDMITLTAAGTNPFFIFGYSTLANAQANLLNSGYLYVSDVMNQASHTWSNYTQTYAANGVLDSKNTAYDNGTREFIDYDNANNQTWQTVTDSFDSLNRQTSRNTLNDDNSQSLATFDATNTQSWMITTDSFDTLNRLVTRNVLNDNASSTLTTFDAANNQIWSTTVDSFDTLNRLTSHNTFNDDNSHNLLTFDATNTQSWTTTTDNYDNLSRLLAHTVLNDDATRSITTYDAVNNQTWTSQQLSFDTANHLTNSVTSNDNGTSLYLTYDPNNGQVWSLQQANYDGATHLTNAVTYYDNTTSLYLTYDPSNAQTWTSQQSNYDSATHLTNTVSYNDDGTSLYLTYDPSNVQTWASQQSNYDNANHLTNTVTYYDNGSSLYLTYDPANTQTWSSQQSSFDNLGHLVSTVTNNDDGSSMYLTYDPANAQTWHDQQANYDNLGRNTNLIVHNDDLTSVYTTYDAAHNQLWQYEQANYNAANVLVLHFRLMDDNTIVYL